MAIKDKLTRFVAAVCRHKYLLTIAFFILHVGFLGTNSFWNKSRLSRQNEEMENEIKQYERQFHASQAKLHRLKSDPGALIRVAREDHQMKSPGEDVYYIIQSDSTVATQ